MTHLTPEEFGAAFESFRRSAFRLELLDRYVAANETEPFRRFLAGEPQDPAWREPWKEFVRGAVRDGKRITRVHVVDEPLSDYLEFELTCGYPAGAAAGEDVRILRRHGRPHLSLTDYDFWLFDDDVAVAMAYDADGNFLGADTITDQVALSWCRRVRTLAIRHSQPLADYLASLGMKEAV
jgi:hypothetical protein